MIVGRQNAFHLQSENAPCVDQVTMKDERGKPLKATWKLLKADELEVEVPLKEESAGPVLTLVAQSGLAKPDEVPMQMYSEAAHLDHFSINAGRPARSVDGTRLDEVSGVELENIAFRSRGSCLALTERISCVSYLRNPAAAAFQAWTEVGGARCTQRRASAESGYCEWTGRVQLDAA